MNDATKFFWENRPTSATQALHDVMTERYRQMVVEGWTAKHDDEHGDGAMAVAAACYALASEPVIQLAKVDFTELWKWTGWAKRWWKPKDTRSNLVRAAALLLAEIERRDRAAARGLQGTDTRTCTCHPDDNPPRPCPRKFALNECRVVRPLAPAHAADPRGPEFTQINQHDAIVHPAGVTVLDPLNDTQAELDAVSREMDVVYARWPKTKKEDDEHRVIREGLLAPLRARCVEIGQRRYRIAAGVMACVEPSGKDADRG